MIANKKYTILNENAKLFMQTIKGNYALIKYRCRQFKSVPNFTYFSIVGDYKQVENFDKAWNQNKMSQEKHIDLYKIC